MLLSDIVFLILRCAGIAMFFALLTVFSGFMVSSVAGTFSLFSITAAFLLLPNQNLTCYTVFRIIPR